MTVLPVGAGGGPGRPHAGRPHAVEVAAALRNPLAPAAGKGRPLPAAVLDRRLEHAAGARRRPRLPCRPWTGVRAIIVLSLCIWIILIGIAARGAADQLRREVNLNVLNLCNTHTLYEY